MKFMSVVVAVLATAGCASGPSAVPPTVPAPAPGAATRWRTTVSIPISGCNGCEDCRTAIRQVFAARSGGRVRLWGSTVEIRYDRPSEVRLPALLEDPRASGLDKIRVQKAHLDAVGRVERLEGRLHFVLDGTEQRFPLDPAGAPEPGGWVRLLGVWDDVASPLRVEDVRALPDGGKPEA